MYFVREGNELLQSMRSELRFSIISHVPQTDIVFFQYLSNGVPLHRLKRGWPPALFEKGIENISVIFVLNQGQTCAVTSGTRLTLARGMLP